MKKIPLIITSLCLFLLPVQLFGKSYVSGKIMGQLGNQMFIIAATYGVALDNNAEPLFPDFRNPTRPAYENLALNYKMIFNRLNISPIGRKTYVYNEPFFHYSPIKFRNNMKLFGYFQSEKYFKKHKETIIDLFSPSSEILSYLEKYQDIIENPATVAVHVRSYLMEDPTGGCHPTLSIEYFEKAMELFSEDSLFVIFSNDIKKCKKEFAHIDKNIRFIENEIHIHDFYLMSMCKHHIISNSTFSWWAAYINRNPDKIIIAPSKWFGPKFSMNNTKDLIPDEWKILKI